MEYKNNINISSFCLHPEYPHPPFLCQQKTDEKQILEEIEKIVIRKIIHKLEKERGK